MNSVSLPRVTFIGYGEAGGILAEDLASRGIAVKAYDLLVADPAGRERLLEGAEGRCGVVRNSQRSAG